VYNNPSHGRRARRDEEGNPEYRKSTHLYACSNVAPDPCCRLTPRRANRRTGSVRYTSCTYMHVCPKKKGATHSKLTWLSPQTCHAPSTSMHPNIISVPIQACREIHILSQPTPPNLLAGGHHDGLATRVRLASRFATCNRQRLRRGIEASDALCTIASVTIFVRMVHPRGACRLC